MAAHADLMAAGLTCTLDRRPRLVTENDVIAAARTTVAQAVKAQGLDFESAVVGAA
jgi:glutamate-ammonia-ligase adenylyltransferase